MVGRVRDDDDDDNDFGVGAGVFGIGGGHGLPTEGDLSLSFRGVAAWRRCRPFCCRDVAAACVVCRFRCCRCCCRCQWSCCVFGR